MTGSANDAPQSAIDEFLAAPLRQKYQKLQDAKTAKAVREYLGDSAYDDLTALVTGRGGPGALNVNIAPNIVFVPGVMGSLLSSRRGGMWWIDARARDQLNELRLAPDGVSDLKPEYGIRAFEVDIMYMPFLIAIDERDDFNFESFAYDWRKPLSASADRLRDLVNRLYSENNDDPVHIVAHSMGGLMLRTALMMHPDLWEKIDRIVFVATPHYGSGAIAGYLKNHLWGFELLSLLGTFLDRATFRSMWGVLSLLPASRGVYPGTRASGSAQWSGGDGDDYVHPCANFDLYAAEEWKLGLDATNTQQLQNALDAVRRFHEQLHASHEALMQAQRGRMAVIAGVGYETLFRLAYEKRFWGAWEKAEKTTSRKSGDPHREGDGRVPVASAALENVGDTRYCVGVHAELPNIPIVYRDVFRWLNGEAMELPDTPGGALAGHLGGPAGPAGTGLTRLTPVDTAKGDPGYWKPVDDPQQLAALQQKLQANSLPEFNRVRLL